MPQPTRRRGASPIPPPPPAELRRHYVTERRSLDDLAACYHVSAWTVKRWLRNAGIHRQPAMWATRVTAADLHALCVEQELTIGEIAAREHVSPNIGLARAPAPPDPQAPCRRFSARSRWSSRAGCIWRRAGRSRRLAGHYQVSYTTIHHRLAAAAIPLRPRGAPARRPPAAGKAAEDAARGG